MNKLTELRKIMMEHQKADQLVQGSWWDSEAQTGCFYGCAMRSDEDAIGKAIDKFKIEPWVAYWSEKVFEGLPKDLALNWPVELLDAMIEFDGDYKDVYHKLSIKRLESLPNTTYKHVNEAVKKVIDYHLKPTEDKREAAYSAAYSASYSSYSARSAAYSARSAADSAADSAEWSARSARVERVAPTMAARSAELFQHWVRERKWMLELLGVSE